MKLVTLDTKLAKYWREDRPNAALPLRPIVTKMPLPIQKYDDPFLPFGKAIIDATRDLVAAYLFDMAAYLALGATGAIALERTVAYASAGGETATILHGAFANTDFVEAAVAFNVDAVTCMGNVDAPPYQDAGIGVIRLPESGLLPVALADDSMIAHGRSLALASWTVAYAGSRDDFAEQARVALQVAMQKWTT